MSPAASYRNLVLVDVSETGSREYGSDDPSNEESEMGSTGSEEEHEIENREEIENQLELLNVVIDSAEKAIAIYEKNNQFDSVCESIRFLNPIMDKGLDLYYDLKQQENLNSLEKRQNELRKKYIKAFLREHNEPEIADAHYVESGAVVFSRSGQDISLGASNIENDVVVIVKNNTTNERAVARINGFTDLESLISDLLEPLDSEDHASALSVEIIGARNFESEDKRVGRQASLESLSKVLMALDAYPHGINLTSLSVGKTYPSAVVSSNHTLLIGVPANISH